MKNYALITGASKGIGLELAKLFAKDGYSLVMVARSNDLLEKLKEEFTKEYGVDVVCIAKDLSNPSSAKEVLRYADALKHGFKSVRKNKILTLNNIIEI